MRLHRLLKPVLGPLLTLLVVTSLQAQSQPQLVSDDLQELAPGVISPLEPRRSLVAKAVKRVRGAVVNIHSERTVRQTAQADAYKVTPNRINGMGTGIIIDPRGYIVTNSHVVEDVNIIRVRLADNSLRHALVVARAPEVDIAILKIDVNQPLPIMPIGTARDLMVGESVLAVGNAFGYEHTVSVGVVSAIKRDVSLNKEISYKSLIQTDASINPGNSGGPLINVHGDLVGVNVAIRAGAQGIGFAIPVDHMIHTVTRLLHSKRRTYTYDGITYGDRIKTTSKGAIRATMVEHVSAASPADQAGFKSGDLLLKVGNTHVSCSFDVERAFLGRHPGDAVPVLFRRDGRNYRTTMTLAAPRVIVPQDGTSQLAWHKLGLRLSPVDGRMVARVHRQLNGGLEVLAVDANSVAARAGIRRGDILVGLHQWETVSLDNIAYILGHRDLPSLNPLRFYVVRSGRVVPGYLRDVP